jgi:CRISPR-associated endonuclease/helicase Cas3
MIDSGNVTQHLWERHLSWSFKREIADLLQLPIEEAGHLISFWTSLHDIGKAGPAFQRKMPELKHNLEKLGLVFSDEKPNLRGYHATATTWILLKYYRETIPNCAPFYNSLALSLGGHHGEFPLIQEILDSPYKKDHIGDSQWYNLQIEFIKKLSDLFQVPNSFAVPTDQERLNSLFLLLAGLTTTVDWIASNENNFSYDAGSMAIEEYFQKSCKDAAKALENVGWNGWQADGISLEFSQLFPGFDPNLMQKEFIESTKSLQSPYMIILEAPTGMGKTEAALYLTDLTLQKESKSGFYIAMPSQATSNQIFERTVNFLNKRYPQDHLNVHLVHGSALLNEFNKNIHHSCVDQDGKDPYANVNSEGWFLPRKRTLLAPFGIGTVDQTFQSVLRSKHFFLRLFGLSNKIIVFDEVHAYDVYMVEIFKRLLEWLRIVNSSIIILTATLPDSSKSELVNAYFNQEIEIPKTKFPRLTICEKGVKVIQLGESISRTVSLDWLADDQLERTISEKIGNGGNIAIMCNRVKRVQELYSRISVIIPEDEITVFHSRYPYYRRAEIEKDILASYGKETDKRPQRSIVIATQVIEQSLDLDFDLIISDLAPIDLLIQRIGRLHRHSSRFTFQKRPFLFADPKIYLIYPNLVNNKIPDFGKDCFVYEKYLLERTYFALRSKNALVLPDETDELINEVYSQTKSAFIPDEYWPEIETHFFKMINKNVNSVYKAENLLIPTPKMKIFGSFSSLMNEDERPESLSLMQVVTRNAPPSVQVVCLNKTESGLQTMNSGYPINFDAEPGYRAAENCLRSSLTISDNEIVNYFLSTQVPETWKKSAALRSHFPIIFTEREAEVAGKKIVFDPKMGISIEDIKE